MGYLWIECHLVRTRIHNWILPIMPFFLPSYLISPYLYLRWLRQRPHLSGSRWTGRRQKSKLWVPSTITTGLRQFDSHRRVVTSFVTAAVSDERRRSTYLFLIKAPAHHSAPSSAVLAEGFRADCIQKCSPCVQVSTRVRTCIPYWRALSGGRRRGSSATPFQFIFIIDCQPHPTPYCRWPSFPGCCCSCLEQSARSCHFCTFRSSLPVAA